MERKILSIAPSFNCSLSCDGCYLTTGVTKEMRNLTKDDWYWKEAMTLAVRQGYKEFAMTLNPYPGAVTHAMKLATMARSVGFEVINVTTVGVGIFFKYDDEGHINEHLTEGLSLLPLIDILSISIDETRCKTLYHMYELVEFFSEAKGETVWDGDSYRPVHPDLHVNLNLLWTPTVFDWAKNSCNCSAYSDTLMDDYVSCSDELNCLNRILLDATDYDMTVQHLIYKPLTLYPSGEWFRDNYEWVVENRPNIAIHGDGKKFIGDAAFNNLMGLNECPGKYMLDIDPMGQVRRCPENPITHNGRTIADLEDLLIDGIPGCGEQCNCITGEQ